MGQSSTVVAFRSRLLRWGYTEISIERVICQPDENFYLVSAVEPLAKKRISFTASEDRLRVLLRKQIRKDR